MFVNFVELLKKSAFDFVDLFLLFSIFFLLILIQSLLCPSLSGFIFSLVFCAQWIYVEVFFFNLFKYLLMYLAALDLSFGMRTLSYHVWDLFLRGKDWTQAPCIGRTES